MGFYFSPYREDSKTCYDQNRMQMRALRAIQWNKTKELELILIIYLDDQFGCFDVM